MSRKNYLWLAKLIVVLPFILASSCKQETQQAPPPPEVQVIEVIQKDFPLVREFVGQTFGQSDIAIRARVEGFLEGIHFEEGRNVHKNQLLYTIDPQPFLAKEAEALSGVAEAKTLLVKAESDLNRIRPLAEINAVSKSDLDFAVAQYGATEASLEAAEAALRAARIQLGYTKMYSPIEGIIGRTQAKIGDFVGREPNPVVLNTVSNIESVQVRFFLTENEYIFLTSYYGTTSVEEDLKPQRKNTLTLVLADGSIHDQKGSIDFIDRSIDPRTGSILIQGSFLNPDRNLRPGQFARILVDFETIPGALLVPQRCITDLQGKQFLYVVSPEDEIEYRQVVAHVGKQGIAWVESGLNPGEKVVFEGLQKVSSGMKVKPVLTEYVLPENDASSASSSQ
jgi:membrane fusion protein (multidrug efflux system)